MFLRRLSLLVSTVFTLLAVAALPACKDYPYSTSLPGTLDVRFKTVSTNIPYSPLNSLPMQLTVVRAIRSDNAKQEVFEDLRAIRRYTSYFDAFSIESFDSTNEIGQSSTPPGSFIGIDLIIQPIGMVTLDGYRFISISTSASVQTYIALRTPISIQEAKTTTVVVTFNVDSSLTRGAESFYYKPKFTISSVQIE